VKGRFLWAFFALLVGTAALGLSAAHAQTSAPRVLAVEFDNDVNPVTADFVIDGIERANDENYDAVVILLDTHGGLASSMEDIYKKELERTDVPVIVYVSPEGAKAASAGVWIGQAGDILAMAPQTNIGSSTPVGVGGEEIGDDLRRKVVNDAAAYIRELAEESGRNGDVAEDFVREAKNIGARTAREENVIEAVAEDLPTLLDEIDGTRTRPKGIVMNTAGAEIETVEMSLWKRVLDTLIDPNLIVLFMSLGVLGITIEILNPGLIFPGTIGAVSLIVGLFGLQVLPVSWAGLLLLLLAAAFFVAEAFVTSHGALSLAGAVSFVVGSLMLFDPAGEAYQVSVWVALAIGGTLALLIGLAIAKVVTVRRSKPQTGEEEMLGEIGIARGPLDPTGNVFIHGELWRARANGEPIASGERVQVVRIGEGLELEVRRVEAPEEREPAETASPATGT
jgi:membrane-bound serine protease (ClpP class)